MAVLVIVVGTFTVETLQVDGFGVGAGFSGYVGYVGYVGGYPTACGALSESEPCKDSGAATEAESGDDA